MRCSSRLIYLVLIFSLFLIPQTIYSGEVSTHHDIILTSKIDYQVDIFRGDIVFGEDVLWTKTYTISGENYTLSYLTPPILKETTFSNATNSWTKDITLSTSFSEGYSNITFTESIYPYDEIFVSSENTTKSKIDNDSITFFIDYLKDSMNISISGIYAGNNTASVPGFGSFVILPSQGKVDYFNVSDDLEINFSISGFVGPNVSVDISLPFELPDGYHLYLWKEYPNNTIQVPYEILDNGTTLRLYLEDGVIDDDGLRDGIIRDPLSLIVPDYDIKIDKNSTDAKIRIDDKALDLVISDGNLTEINIVDPKSLPKIPISPDGFQHKLVKFRVDNLTGDSIDVEIDCPDVTNPDLWKFNPNTMEWYKFPFTRNGSKVYITIVDGGLGDDDGIKNGIIEDDLGITTMWWNSSWSWRTAFNISNTVQDLTDYQVKIILNTSNFNFSEAKDNLSDLRFVYYNSSSDTEIEMSYWMESNNSANYSSGSINAIFWTKVPFIENNTYTTIFVYHGNDNAQSISNATATFEFFDDATGTYSNQWTTVEGTASYALVAGKQAISLSSATTNIRTLSYQMNGGFAIDAELYATSLITAIQYYQDATPTTNEHYHARIDTRAGYEEAIVEDGGFTGGETDVFSGTSTWVDAAVYVDQDANHNFYVDGTLADTRTADVTYTSGYLALNHHNAGTGAVANLRVRKYVYPEPSLASLGDEYSGLLEIDIDQPMQDSQKVRFTPFTMNGTVNCSRGNCGNVSVFYQYYATATPTQSWIETTTDDFNSLTSSINNSISSDSITLLSSVGVSWWNSDWEYRQRYNLTNSAGNLTDHQIRLIFNSSNIGTNFNWSTDENTTRFVWYNISSGNNIELSYWVEKWNKTNQNASIWIKFPFIENNTNTTFYMYYGNPNSVSSASTTDTFDFYSNGSSLSGWSVVGASVNSGSGNPLPSLEALGGEYAYKDIGLTSDSIIEFDAYPISGANALMNLYFLTDNAGLGQMFRIETRTATSPGFATTTDWSTWNAPSGYSPVTDDTWHNIEIIINGSTAYGYIDGSGYGNIVVSDNGGYIAVHGDAGVVEGGYFDNIRVRGYASSEPTMTKYGIEQTINYSTPGEYISSIFDTGTADVTYENISWTSSTNTNTSLSVYTRSSTGASYDWYYADLLYREEFSISNTYQDLNDYQVEIIANLSDSYSNNNILQFCEDVKFTYVHPSTGEDEISFYTLDCNLSSNTSATFWVKIPYLKNDTNTEVRLYYGNTTIATSMSDANSTFLFFDHFKGSSINSTEWDDSGVTGSYDVNNDLLRMWGNWGGCCTGGCIYSGLETTRTFTAPFVVESRYKLGASNTLANCNTDYNTIFNNFDVFQIDTGNQELLFRDSVGTVKAYDLSPTIAVDTWYQSEVSFETNMINGTTSYLSSYYNLTGTVSSSGILELASDVETANVDAGVLVDWIMVREYASVEPSVSLLDSEVQKNDTVSYSWSPWALESNGTSIQSPNRRYIEYKVETSTSNTKQTPIFDDITIDYKISTTGWADMNPTGTVFTADSPYNCGIMSDETCISFLNVTPTEVGDYSVRFCAQSDSSEIETICSETRNISVWMQPDIIDFTSSVNPLGGGKTSELDAKLTNDQGVGVQDYTMTFTDMNASRWWNTDWDYRKQINLTINESGNNYQVKLSINLSSEFGSGYIDQYCSDIRFTSVNDSTNDEETIYYWIESCNLSNSDIATVWVKIPSITANKLTEIYAYYGNSGQSSESDLLNTMEVFEVGNTVVGTSWQTINLDSSYENPVIVTTYNLDSATDNPAVTRITNITADSFRIKIQNPGDGTIPTTDTVHYIVMDSGKWNLVGDGTKIEAQKYLSTQTDNYLDWSPVQQSYLHTYSTPVVQGQVMSYNDLNWSVFWTSDSSYTGYPTSTEFYTGKHVGKDPDTTRNPETIGLIIAEQSSGTIQDKNYAFTLGGTTVGGVDSAPPYTYALGFTADTAIATQSGMLGGDGGWCILYGSNPLAGNALDLAIDEDEITDNRGHTLENVAYFVFEDAGYYPIRENTSSSINITVGNQTYRNDTLNGPSTIGSDITDRNGDATQTYLASSQTEPGIHILNASYAGDPSNYILSAWEIIEVTFASTPHIKDLVAQPASFGHGYNTTISSNVTNEVGTLTQVVLHITYPNGTTDSKNMPNVGDIYSYEFPLLWDEGQYDYYIEAINSYGITAVSDTKYFLLEDYLDFSISTDKDAYKNYEYVHLDSGYGNHTYRIEIDVDSSNSTTDYQVELNLDSSNFDFSHALNDGADIRFKFYNTTSDSEEEASYWIEYYNSTAENATIWVKLPNISIGSNSIYMYYGNKTSITTASNGSATFEFFDHFPGTSLDTGKWDNSAVTGSYDVVNDSLRMWNDWGGCCGGGCIYEGLKSKTNFTSPIVVESRFQLGPDNLVTTSCRVDYNTIFNHSDVVQFDTATHDVQFLDSVSTVTPYDLSPTVSTDTWYRSEVVYGSGFMNATTSYLGSYYGVSGTVSTAGAIEIAADVDTTPATAGVYVDWIAVRKYLTNEPTVTYGSEEKVSLTNLGDTDVKGYLYMLVERWTGSVWMPEGTPIVDSEFIEISNNSDFDLIERWESNGEWYTSNKQPGLYRIFAALYGPDYFKLNDSTGTPITGTYEFNISESILQVSGLEHENDYSFSLQEYETGDNLAWVNITVIATENRALDADITLNLIDQSYDPVGWGPDSTKSCGEILEGQTCERRWDNSTNGYHIPLDVGSGTYVMRWNVSMDTTNGPLQTNNSIQFSIHNIPATFSKSVSKTRLYKPNSTDYNISFTNQWSTDIQNVTIKINCEKIVGLDCVSLDSGTDTYYIGNVSSSTQLNLSFNITVNESVPSDDYDVNITLNYTNPGDETKSWNQYLDQKFEVRSLGILAIDPYDYELNMTRMYSYDIKSSANNTGDTAATDIWFNYTLPNAWSVTSGTQNLFDAGPLPKYDQLWNNITVDLGQSAALGEQTINLYSSASDGRTDWKSFDVTVFADTWVDVSTPTWQNRGYNTTVNATLYYDNNTPIVGELIHFYDQTNDTYIGNDTTDAQGIASVIYTLPSDLALGNHIINASFAGDPSIYVHSSANSTITDIRMVPQISGITTTPSEVGFGRDVVIEAEVTDDQIIENVYVNITDKDGASEIFEMVPIGPTTYQYTFDETWTLGGYNVTIWANDSDSSVAQSGVYNFTVNVTATMLVSTEYLEYDKNEYVNLSGGTAATWYSDSHMYRYGVNISNSAGNLTDQQIKVEIDMGSAYSSGRIQNDCDDIVVTYLNSTSGQEQVIGHFIDICNLTQEDNITLFAKVPLVENATDTFVYIYYGDPDASSTSNGSATFDFFDDFLGTSIDTSKWDTTDAGSYDVTGGMLRMWGSWGGCCGGTCVYDGLKTKASFNSPVTVEVKHKWGTNNPLTSCAMDLNVVYNDLDAAQIDTDTRDLQFRDSIGSVQAYDLSPSISTDTWYRFEVQYGSGTINATTDYIDGYSGISGTVSSSGPIDLVADTEGASASYGSHIDWVGVRKGLTGKTTINLMTEESRPSKILNSGTNFSGYLRMKIQYDDSGSWINVTTVIDDITAVKERDIDGFEFNLSEIWNNVSWFIGTSDAGDYRVYSELLDPDGSLLIASNGPMNATSPIFKVLQPPLVLNITDFTVYSVTAADPSNWRIYVNDLIGYGLNRTYDLGTGNIYRIEFEVENIGGSIWNLNETDITHFDLNSSWEINNLEYIWYSNESTESDARTDTSFKGGIWNGSVIWNTSDLMGQVPTGETARFFYIVNVTSAGDYGVNFFINHATFTEEDYSVFHVIEVDYVAPQLYSNIYGLTDSTVIRGDSTQAYARWDETIKGANITYTTTSPAVWAQVANNSPENVRNWTNFTITTYTNWFLGSHNVRIMARDESYNWNKTLPYLTLDIYGLANVASINVNDSTPDIGTYVEITCSIVDSTTSTVISGYNVTFYNDGAYIGSNLTDGSGDSVLYYYVDSPGDQEIKCNITPSGWYYVGTDEDSTSIFVIESVAPKYSDPSQYNVVHKGDTISLDVYWTDNYELDDATLSINTSGTWSNHSTINLSGNESWANFSYQVATDAAIGTMEWKQYGSDTSSNLNQTPAYQFDVWGWSTIGSADVTPANIQEGNSTTMTCTVTDSNESIAIENYNVTFWIRNSTGTYQYLGYNLTESDGETTFGFNVTSAGTYTVKCNITDDSSKSYNSSASYHDTDTLNVVVGSDIIPPQVIGSSYQINDTQIIRSDCIKLSAQWDESLNISWIEYDPYVIGDFVVINLTQPYTANWTNITLCANDSWIVGNHSIKLFAKDLSGNINSTLEYKRFNLTSNIEVRWSDPIAGESINRSNSVQLACNVTDKDTGGGVGGYQVKFYDDNAQLIGTVNTNSSGTATESYDASTRSVGPSNDFYCKIETGQYQIVDLLDREDARSFTFYGVLSATIDTPSDGSILNRGISHSMQSTVRDENNNPVASTVDSWYSISQISSQEDFIWSIPGSYTLGPRTIIMNTSKSYYYSAQDSISVDIYGWSQVSMSSPDGGSYGSGQDIDIICKVTDSNTTNGINNYPVRFMDNTSQLNLLYTDSNGDVNLSVSSDTLSEGSHNIRCVIDHNDTLYYNYTIAEANSIIQVDKTAPNISYNPTTDENGTYNKNWIYVSVNATDTTLDTVLLYWNGVPESFQNHVDDTYWSNKTPLTSGDYDFYAYANESTGASSVTGNRSITLDLERPTLHIISPFDKVYDINSIDFNVSGNEALSECWFDIGSVYTMNQLNSTFYYNQSVSVPEGMTEAVFYCNDTVGNIGNKSVNFTVDITAPSLQMNSPVDTKISSISDIDFNCTASDNIDLINVSLFINISSWNPYSTNLSGINDTDYIFSHSIPDGTYVWACQACDQVNCNMTTNRTLTVDTEVPVISIESPINSSTFNSTSFNLNFTVTDTNLDSCWYFNGTDNTSLPLCQDTGITLSEGQHTIIVYANDSAGLIGSSKTSFYIDLTAPTATILYPMDGAYFSSQDYVQFNYTRSDEHDLDSCWYILDTGSPVFIPGCDNTTIIGISNDNHTLTLHVNDTGGNTVTDSIWFVINLTALSLTPQSPENDSFWNSGWIWANVSTNKPAVSCNYSIDGGNTPMTNETSLFWSENATGLSETKHNITYLCTDELGNVTQSDYRYFTIDLTNPSLTLESPIDQVYNISDIPLNYTTSDTNSITCSYSLDSGSFTDTSCNNLTLSSLGEGYHNLTVRIIDAAGNINTSFIEFEVDTILPVLTVISPDNISYPYDNIWFNVSVGEIASSCWYNIGLGNTTLTNLNDTYHYTNKTLSDGNYNITFYCNDSASNIGETDANFTVDTTGPTINFEDPTPTDGKGLGVNWTYINISTDEDADSVILEWNGVTNYTMISTTAQSFWYNISGLSDDTYTYRLFANDTLGNYNWSAERSVTISTLAPAITIISPVDTTYDHSVIPLEVTASKDVVDWWFEMNGETFDLEPNTTITSRLGNNTITVYAQDNLDQIGNKSVSFNFSNTIWDDNHTSFTGYGYSENINNDQNASIEFCWSELIESSLPQDKRESCWHYRRLINVTSSSDLTDYQARLDIDLSSLKSSGKLDGNCSDIRFTAEGSEIPYWIEDCGNSTKNASIYIKMSDINSTTDVYMYYGNEYAEDASNGTDVFLFFDTFDTVKSSVWGSDASNWGSFEGISYPTAGGSSSDIEATYSYPNSYATEIRISANTSATGVKYYHFGNGAGNKNIRFYLDPGSSRINLYTGSNNYYSTDSSDIQTYTIISDFQNNEYKVFMNNTDQVISTSSYISGSRTTPKFYSFSAYGLYVDFIAVRKYSSNGPAHSDLGSEETPVVNGTVQSIDINPESFWEWDDITAIANIPAGTNITFRILNSTNGSLCGDLYYSDLSSGYSVCSAADVYPSVKLYAELSTDTTFISPELYNWDISWITQGNLRVESYNETGLDNSAHIRFYEDSVLKTEDYASLTANITRTPVYDLELSRTISSGKIKLEISDLDLISNDTQQLQTIQSYSGTYPKNFSDFTPIIAYINGYNFTSAKLTIPKSGVTVNMIAHCTSWSLSNANCSNWEVNTTGNYTGFSENSTHIIFNVTEFDAYAGISYGMEPPVINSNNATPDTQFYGRLINITANVTDDDTVSTVIVEIDDMNHTMAGGPIYNYTFNTSSYSVGTYNYTIYANDTSGNWAEPVNGTFTILANIDLSIQDIIFSQINMLEGQNITIIMNVSNTGLQDAQDVSIRLNISRWNGTWINRYSMEKTVDINSSSSSLVEFDWIAGIGTYKFEGLADSKEEFIELDETNNVYSENETISSWQIYYGSFEDHLYVLGADADEFKTWNISVPEGTMYFSDYDLTYYPSALRPLNGTDDLAEADASLNLTGNLDSLSELYDSDDNGIPDQFSTFTISGNSVSQIPVINSTNTSTFVTGIMWTGIGNEYNGSQNLIFVTKINASSLGMYGTYDYEVRVPSNLKRQNAGFDQIKILDELI